MRIQKGKFEIASKTHKTYDSVGVDVGGINIIEGDTFVTFTVDDISFSNVDGLNPSKFYYHPIQSITKDDFPRTRLLKSFEIYQLYDCNYVQDNFIHFEFNGNDYSLITNTEYVLRINPHMNGYSITIYFGDVDLEKSTRKYFSIEIGKKIIKRSNYVHLPKPKNPTIKMMDYFVLDGYKFSETYDDTYIGDVKEKIKDILSDYKWYFFGTSIFDYARDIDIHANKDDYEDILKTLSENGFERRTHEIGHGGAMFRIPNKKFKLDVVISDYDRFEEPTNGRNADPLFMYFIQSNYYTSICRDNLSELFKEYRLNKLIDTKERLEIKYTQPYYQNTYMSEERSNHYYDVLDDYQIVNDDISSSVNCSVLHIEKEEWNYLIIKSHHTEQLLSIELPYEIHNFEVVDGEDAKSIISKVMENGKTLIRVNTCNSYSLVRFKK